MQNAEMIRDMRDTDYPRAFAVWRACFEDDEDYFRFFWEHGFPLCRGLCLEEDGQAVSMLFLLPGALGNPSALGYRKTLLSAWYVYAVATLPAYRGRGYASELTCYAAALAKGEGLSALCLRPADEGLYGYYAKLGFVKAFARQERPVRHGRFAWDAPMKEYLLRESEFTGRDMRPARELGGMVLPLDTQAEKWLRKTKGRAYMGPALE